MKVDQLCYKQDCNDIHCELNPQNYDYTLTFKPFFLDHLFCNQKDKQQNGAQFKDKIGIYKSSKLSIISRANAIIQPVTVVIELLTASIASATVLCTLLHVRIADVAVEVHRFAGVVPDWIKCLFFGLHITLLKH